MPKILVWNVRKQKLNQLLHDIIESEKVDLAVLIEPSVEGDPDEVISDEFQKLDTLCDKLVFYAKRGNKDFSEVHSDNRLSIRRCRSSKEELLLGFVHLVDKQNFDIINQAQLLTLLSQDIQSQEDRLKNDRVILAGDFNLNPFEQAMNSAAGLNAMMTTACVSRCSRKFQDCSYPFFYNPMWSLLGDKTPGPSGTFYHSSSGNGFYGWNMLDQVLVRPSAIPSFEWVRILTHAGTTSLQDKLGRPNKKIASDHFPILFSVS